MELQNLVGQKILLAFHGKESPSPEIIDSIRRFSPGGFTLFRSLNIDAPAQVRALTAQLQALARQQGLQPFLIGTDQEGGQLMAVGGCTPLPGNMALGAARSAALARRAGEVLGRELAALGINVDYAPCMDVNINPHNPVIGTRSFGDDPALVGELGCALIEGLQSQGVAAAAKHFPGHGDTQSDSHHKRVALTHSLERLHAVELPPFTAAIQAGVKMVMASHIGIQALDGPDAPPATLSESVLSGLLRAGMGFQGVTVTDALDMRAIRQGELLRQDAVQSARAGADLLLVTGDPADHARVAEALLDAARRGELPGDALHASVERILELKRWIAANAADPGLEAVGCAQHLRVAQDIADQSITLLRDRAGLLPLRLAPRQRVAVLAPQPQDLTPADTSSYLTPCLAAALREFHPQVDEFILPFDPGDAEICALLAGLEGYDLVVAGTINACHAPGQAQLLRSLLERPVPLIGVAMRLPYDLQVFPRLDTYVCCYSILEPAMRAAAKALFGRIPFAGRLPVAVNAG